MRWSHERLNILITYSVLGENTIELGFSVTANAMRCRIRLPIST